MCKINLVADVSERFEKKYSRCALSKSPYQAIPVKLKQASLH
jgi:hypothetical protein